MSAARSHTLRDMTLRMRRLSPAMQVRTLVGGKQLPAEFLSFSIRNFGRRVNGNAVSYEMLVDAEDFVQRFRPIYDECMEELKREDALVEMYEPLYHGATSYPTLEEFLELGIPARMQITSTHFTFDVLRLYLAEDVPGLLSQWTIVSLDSLASDGEVVTIAGRAVRR